MQVVINGRLLLVKMATDSQELQFPLIGGVHVGGILFWRIANQSAFSQNIR